MKKRKQVWATSKYIKENRGGKSNKREEPGEPIETFQKRDQEHARSLQAKDISKK